MLVKNVVLALVSLAMVAEASVIDRSSPYERALERRQAKKQSTSASAAQAKSSSAAQAKSSSTAAQKSQGSSGKSSSSQSSSGNTGDNAASNTGSDSASLCLNANAVQTGSQITGQVNGVPAEGQVNSLTDPANFINHCSGKTLTNGLQVKTGSCNGVVMGDIPATTKMSSIVLLFPPHNGNVEANTQFNVSLQLSNLKAGSFTNATSTYYSAPQTIDEESGTVIGHVHVTIQDMGANLTPTSPLDPTNFTFFKGINDDGNGQGLLQAVVTDGLPVGNYRVCTISGASNHQPVLMPIAQRGAQDDCNKFTVTASGGSSTSSSGSSSTGSSSSASTSSASKSSTSSSSSNGSTGKTSSVGAKEGGGSSSTNSASSGSESSSSGSSSSDSNGSSSGSSSSSGSESNSSGSSSSDSNGSSSGSSSSYSDGRGSGSSSSYSDGRGSGSSSSYSDGNGSGFSSSRGSKSSSSQSGGKTVNCNSKRKA